MHGIGNLSLEFPLLARSRNWPKLTVGPLCETFPTSGQEIRKSATGPKLPFVEATDAALQLPGSRRLLIFQHLQGPQCGRADISVNRTSRSPENDPVTFRKASNLDCDTVCIETSKPCRINARMHS